MKFEDVSEKIEWEARRVATAIDADEYQLVDYEYAHVSPFKHVSYSATHARYIGLWGKRKIGWLFVAEGDNLQDIRLVVLQHMKNSKCMVYRKAIDATNRELLWGPWDKLETETSDSQMLFREHMVRTLYRLGIEMEDEQWLAPLNVSLSHHEKLELRLSMPREFWPKKWLDEANEPDAKPLI
jgi:hypothetical protein